MSKFVIVADADNYCPGYIVVRFRDDPKDHTNELCLKSGDLTQLRDAINEYLRELPSPDLRREIQDLREQLVAQDARILRMEQAEARRRSIENVNNYPPPGVSAVPSPFNIISGTKVEVFDTSKPGFFMCWHCSKPIEYCSCTNIPRPV